MKKQLLVLLLLTSFASAQYFDVRTQTKGWNVLSKTTDYTVLRADAYAHFVLSSASAHTLTLPATAPPCAITTTCWQIVIENEGVGTWTISRNGLTIDGAASNLTLTTNQGVMIRSDGSNYHTMRGMGSSGGASVKVNTSAITGTTANFSDSTPAAASNNVNVTWQKDSSTPDTNISAQVAAATDTVLGVVKSKTCPASQWFSAITTGTGAVTCSQPTFADLSGNLTLIRKFLMEYAGCNAGTAYPAWNLPSSSAMGVACTADNQEGNLTAADGQIAYYDVILPPDFVSFSLVTINFTTTDTTNGHTIIWNLATKCVQPNNNVANLNAPSYNTAGTVTTTIGGSAVSGGVYQATISSLTMTGCSAGYKMRLKLSRATDTDTDTAVQLTDGLMFAYSGTQN